MSVSVMAYAGLIVAVQALRPVTIGTKEVKVQRAIPRSPISPVAMEGPLSKWFVNGVNLALLKTGVKAVDTMMGRVGDEVDAGNRDTRW